MGLPNPHRGALRVPGIKMVFSHGPTACVRSWPGLRDISYPQPFYLSASPPRFKKNISASLPESAWHFQESDLSILPYAGRNTSPIKELIPSPTSAKRVGGQMRLYLQVARCENGTSVCSFCAQPESLIHSCLRTCTKERFRITKSHRLPFQTHQAAGRENIQGACGEALT